MIPKKKKRPSKTKLKREAEGAEAAQQHIEITPALCREIANLIDGQSIQNLALIERNEKLEFREMELREALTAGIDNWALVVVHEATCGKPLLGGCKCSLAQWHEWRSNVRELLKKAPYQRTGESE